MGQKVFIYFYLRSLMSNETEKYDFFFYFCNWNMFELS